MSSPLVLDSTTAAALMNVTVDSLAKLVGVVSEEGEEERTDAERSRFVKMQLGILQRKPQHQQHPVHHEFSARYLPVLVEKYRASSGPLNAPMAMLNVISYTPYFTRFMRTPAGKGIAALQAHRTAEAADHIGNMSVDDVGEIGQFLATLLLLQGTAGVEDTDKKKLIPKLKQWQRTFRGRLAAETSERCLALLTDDPVVVPVMMQHVKKALEGKLIQCGGPNCGREKKQDGGELLQCARCKSAVYCGTEHQKAAWPTHKALCFAPSF